MGAKVEGTQINKRSLLFKHNYANLTQTLSVEYLSGLSLNDTRYWEILDLHFTYKSGKI